MPPQGGDDLLDVPPARGVAVDELPVDVREHGLPRAQREEDGRAAHERLEVARELGRKERAKLREELSLAPGPFEKWLRRSGVGARLLSPALLGRETCAAHARSL